MKTKDSLKLKVFESSLPKEDVSELITMIESASSVDDIDYINEVFSEKVKEIPFGEAYIIASNNKIIDELKKSDIADEIKDCIKVLEDYNKKLINLWKKGTDPKTDRQKYIDIADEFFVDINEKLSKVSLTTQMKYATVSAKAGASTTSSEAKEIKKQLDEMMDIKKRIKSIVNEMRDNVIDAAKKTAEATKSKVEELKEKIKEVKKDVKEDVKED